jgi:predicted Zn-dependent protease
MSSISGLILRIVLILGFFTACAVNPVTGKRELMLLSESDEIKLGQTTDKSVVAMYGIYDDASLNQYISDLGNKMVPVSHRPNLKFEFKVMDSPVINAFAVPGGFVYITRGILAYLNNEAELAGVIGHEIGHVTARHSAKQYTNAQLAQFGLGLGSVLSEDFARYAGLAEQGIGLLFLKFSRDNESQSDDLGVEYSTKVGYDAREMANFFVTLNRMQAGGTSGGLPDWFSTHPNPADRIVAIRTDAANWQKTIGTTNLTINRDVYMNKINGVVCGQNPRQGYAEDNMFYHPDLKFQFPLPAGWSMTNMPSQVQIVSADEQAAIVFSMTQQKTIADAASSFNTSTKGTISSQEDLKVGGMPARKMISVLAGQSGPLQVMSYFIEKDGSVFVFHGFTAQNLFGKYQGAFETSMKGFAPLTDRQKLNVKPDRIHIRKVERQMTLEQALRAFNAPDDKLNELSLMNGMELSVNLEKGMLIKTIDK